MFDFLLKMDLFKPVGKAMNFLSDPRLPLSRLLPKVGSNLSKCNSSSLASIARDLAVVASTGGFAIMLGGGA